MKLSVKALSISFSIMWAGCILLVALANWWWPTYGINFLQCIESIYPGYHVGAGFGSIIVATFYALVDGAVGGMIFGWLFNAIASSKKTGM